MNRLLVEKILQALSDAGLKEICLCPGGRNSPFIAFLENDTRFKVHYWFEERSAAFFALGRCLAGHRPVAVITTSGTAAAELYPAIMEGYYSGMPLLVITSDRPRRFRGTGAPQTADQVGMFGQYTYFNRDLAQGEECELTNWKENGPAHINVCFEEPLLDG